MRTTPKFETGDERYAWLNSLVCVGYNELSPDHIDYRIYRCCSGMDHARAAAGRRRRERPAAFGAGVVACSCAPLPARAGASLRAGSAPVLVLETIGRRSGRPARDAVLYLRRRNRSSCSRPTPEPIARRPGRLNLARSRQARRVVGGRRYRVRPRASAEPSASGSGKAFVEMYPQAASTRASRPASSARRTGAPLGAPARSLWSRRAIDRITAHAAAAQRGDDGGAGQGGARAASRRTATPPRRSRPSSRARASRRARSITTSPASESCSRPSSPPSRSASRRRRSPPTARGGPVGGLRGRLPCVP